MLTKKITFNMAKLEILKQLVWNDNGTEARIVTPLDRKAYEAVNRCNDEA